MSEQLKNRTKKFALAVIGLCAGLPHTAETRHAIGQVIRSPSSVAANYRSASRGKSKADFIAKLVQAVGELVVGGGHLKRTLWAYLELQLPRVATVAVGAGLTRNSPDFRISVALPIRF